MPNWCDNDLEIQGPRIEEVLRAIAGEKRAMDFQKIVPMPEALNNTESGTKEEVALSCVKNDLSHWEDMPWVKNGEISTPRQIAELFHIDYDEAVAYGNQLLQNMQQYGAATWYDWCEQNWGCKWNTRDSGVRKQSETSAKVGFFTPWAPPVPVLRALSRMFPEHFFKLIYADCVGGTGGLLEVKGGEIIRQEDLTISYEDYFEDDPDSPAFEEVGEELNFGDEEDIPF